MVEAVEYLTTADAGRILDLTPAAVRLAASDGRLRVAVVTPSGQRLYSREDVEALASRRQRARRRR
jgi:DNA-binding transcriptional MerR regulator